MLLPRRLRRRAAGARLRGPPARAATTAGRPQPVQARPRPGEAIPGATGHPRRRRPPLPWRPRGTSRRRRSRMRRNGRARLPTGRPRRHPTTFGAGWPKAMSSIGRGAASASPSRLGRTCWEWIRARRRRPWASLRPDLSEPPIRGRTQRRRRSGLRFRTFISQCPNRRRQGLPVPGPQRRSPVPRTRPWLRPLPRRQSLRLYRTVRWWKRCCGRQASSAASHGGIRPCSSEQGNSSTVSSPAWC